MNPTRAIMDRPVTIQTYHQPSSTVDSRSIRIEVNPHIDVRVPPPPPPPPPHHLPEYFQGPQNFPYYNGFNPSFLNYYNNPNPYFGNGFQGYYNVAPPMYCPQSYCCPPPSPCCPPPVSSGFCGNPYQMY